MISKAVPRSVTQHYDISCRPARVARPVALACYSCSQTYPNLSFLINECTTLSDEVTLAGVSEAGCALLANTALHTERPRSFG